MGIGSICFLQGRIVSRLYLGFAFIIYVAKYFLRSTGRFRCSILQQTKASSFTTAKLLFLLPLMSLLLQSTLADKIVLSLNCLPSGLSRRRTTLPRPLRLVRIYRRSASHHATSSKQRLSSTDHLYSTGSLTPLRGREAWPSLTRCPTLITLLVLSIRPDVTYETSTPPSMCPSGRLRLCANGLAIISCDRVRAYLSEAENIVDDTMPA